MTVRFNFTAKGHRDLGPPHHARAQGEVLVRHRVPEQEDGRDAQRGDR